MSFLGVKDAGKHCSESASTTQRNAFSEKPKKKKKCLTAVQAGSKLGDFLNLLDAGIAVDGSLKYGLYMKIYQC